MIGENPGGVEGLEGSERVGDDVALWGEGEDGLCFREVGC